MATGSASDLTRGFRNQPRPRQHRVYRCLVIVEHALRLVRAGLSDEFRSAFADAKVIISRMPGFQLLTMR